jgi:hypothetical protein
VEAEPGTPGTPGGSSWGGSWTDWPVEVPMRPNGGVAGRLGESGAPSGSSQASQALGGDPGAHPKPPRESSTSSSTISAPLLSTEAPPALNPATAEGGELIMPSNEGSLDFAPHGDTNLASSVLSQPPARPAVAAGEADRAPSGHLRGARIRENTERRMPASEEGTAVNLSPAAETSTASPVLPASERPVSDIQSDAASPSPAVVPQGTVREEGGDTAVHAPAVRPALGPGIMPKGAATALHVPEQGGPTLVDAGLENVDPPHDGFVGGGDGPEQDGAPMASPEPGKGNMLDQAMGMIWRQGPRGPKPAGLDNAPNSGGSGPLGEQGPGGLDGGDKRTVKQSLKDLEASAKSGLQSLRAAMEDLKGRTNILSPKPSRPGGVLGLLSPQGPSRNGTSQVGWA